MHNDPAMVKSNFERFADDEYFTIDESTLTGLWHFMGDELSAPGYKFDVWEPACGKGHISKFLESKGLRVKSTDLNEWGYGEGGRDFLQEVFHYKAKHIITNPPYFEDMTDRFVERTLEYIKRTGGVAAFLMRNEWDCAMGRQKFVNYESIFSRKIVLNKRPKWIEGDRFDENGKKLSSSPRHNYAWYIWDGRLNEDTFRHAEVCYYHPKLNP